MEKENNQTNISNKKYILGTKDKESNGILNIGRYYALDSSLGANVYLDVLHPHISLICGKRGYGKSYTIGVIIEELEKLDRNIKNNLTVLVIDTLGIFWTMKNPNNREKDLLKKWKYEPKAFDINLFIPEKYLDEYNQRGIKADSFTIRTSDLSAFQWCQLFDTKSTDPLGIVITRTIMDLKKQSINFSIKDILNYLSKTERFDKTIITAAENFFIMADSWSVFDDKGINIKDFLKPGKINILDLSHLPNPILKSIVTAIFSTYIFNERVKQRKIYEQKKMGKKIDLKGIPMVLMAIDEAQLFLPCDSELASKDILIKHWMRQGRQPGLSLIMATQRPSALDQEVLSHCDTIICHRLTAQEDIDSLSRIRPTYMHGDIKEAVKQIGDEKGVAFIVDDTSETSHIIKIRPRQSWHGGAEPLADDN